MNVCTRPICSDGRWEEPTSAGEQKGCPPLSTKVGIPAACSCLYGDLHRNVLIEVTSKRSHSASIPFIEHCVCGCVVHAHECVGVQQRPGQAIRYLPPSLYTLREGLAQNWKLMPARLTAKQAPGTHGRLFVGFTGCAQLFAWGLWI